MPLDSQQSPDTRNAASAADAAHPDAARPHRLLQSPIAIGLGQLTAELAARARGIRPALTALQLLLQNAYARFLPWAKAQPLWRFCTRSLTHRIFTANLAGLLILLAGLGILTFQHTWLIDAKAESLRAQARMIAVAVASNAKIETETMVIDPDRLQEADTLFPNWRDEALDSMALDIAPERIGPIVRKLIQSGDVRVRIFNRDNVKLVDTDGVAAASRVERLPGGQSGKDGTNQSSDTLKTVWTRATAWLMRSPLQVYREVEAGHLVSGYPEAREALGGQVTSVLLLNDKGEQIISVFAPVQRLKAIPAFIWLTTRPGDLENILWRERRPFFVLFCVALLTTLLASWLLKRTIGGPMNELAKAAEHVSRNINARQEIPDLSGRRDEVGEMAQAYRNMTAALYRRIEASDRFAQDVAHELKNPVAAARSTAEAMAYAKTDQKRDELVRQISSELKRLNRLITDVSKMAVLDAELARQETEPVDVSEIAVNITNVFREIQKSRDEEACVIELRLDPQPAPAGTFVMNGHDTRLGQVLTNLIDNALSFSPTGGLVQVSLHAQSDAIVLRVEDQGPGIPEDKLEDVFKRFYSDRPQSDRISGKNSGLGLSLCREIVEAHGGTIHAQNLKAQSGDIVGRHDQPELAKRRLAGVVGARFEVRLPRGGRQGL